ncbi:Wzz/FepE/Etk N-terminal domain-containing protein [Pseudoroseicyclus tamaricis]|uniref:Polysaccharide chain length determinant N-terminal domain-containing protein n=1 Tax=Pseudoroseicyclus tamaricis TaxID=2705421 RepID=A0A6B2JTH2_9RHOB|nr:Wzz/FepE/Etk N-terminal domain-containing protein [Pseudoroseicyclus tamaricis]NDV01340.1 hypothetical protein [Pseudoroseicyclus tamaricis]
MKQMAFGLADSDGALRPSGNSAANEPLFDLRSIFAVLRRQRMLFPLWWAVFGAISLAYLATTPERYEAVGTILLGGDARLNVNDIGDVGPVTDANVQTALQILRSRQLALDVTDALALDENATFLSPPSSMAGKLIGRARGFVGSSIDRVTSAVAPVAEVPADVAPAPAPDPALVAEERRQAVARMLQGRVVLGRVGDSSAVFISMVTHEPDLSAAIVNGFISAFVADQLSSSFEAASRTTDWLQERLTALEADSREAALAVEAFRVENGMIGSSPSVLGDENMSRLNQALSDAQAELARNRALVAAYDTALALGPEALVSLPSDERLSLPGDARLDNLQGELTALTARRDEVSRNFGPDHPQVTALETQIIDAAERLYAEMEQRARAARGELELSSAAVASLRQQLSDTSSALDGDASAQIELELLERRAESLSRLYDSFLAQSQQTDYLRSFPVANNRVLNPADVPRSPSGPSTTRAIGVAIVLGLMAAMLHATVREWRDTALRTGSQVTDTAGLPFLGYLPKLGSSKARIIPAPKRGGSTAVDKTRVSVAPLDGTSRYIETLRLVRRAAMTHPPSDGGAAVIGVTSALPNEGKTFTSLQLARVMASGIGPVLLIDCDMRQAGLSRLLRLGGEPGLDRVLLGKGTWREATKQITGTEVDVLSWPANRDRKQAGEVLGSVQFRDLIAETREHYTCVILDLAPLGPIVDAREMLPMVDQVLLIAEWGKTPRDILRKIVREEPELYDKLLGVVLNKANLKALRRYARPGTEELHYRNYETYFR